MDSKRDLVKTGLFMSSIVTLILFDACMVGLYLEKNDKPQSEIQQICLSLKVSDLSEQELIMENKET